MSRSGFLTQRRATVRLPSPALERSACRSAVHFLPYAVLLLDAELRLVLANRAASLLFRLPVSQLQGRSITNLLPQANLDKLLANVGTRSTRIFETSLPSARTEAPVALKISAVTVARVSSAREYCLLVLEDISDRTALEQQLVDSEKQAAMGQLAAGILHEVANPLASLGSNLLLVRSRLAGEREDPVTQALDTSIEQLNEIRQLLGTLSGFPGRTFAKPEPADLDEIIHRSVTFMAHEAQRRRVRLEVHPAAETIICEMDVRLMRQVLVNLLKNAMEALPDGGRIDVRTRLRPAEESRPAAAIIEVSDTGVGITPADLRKVFRPLFSTKPRGAGLGLSFCRQTVEEHGGQIRIASRGVNQGTVATVCLPLRQISPIDDDE